MEYDDTETAVTAPLDYHRGAPRLIRHWEEFIPEFVAERKPARSCLYKHRRLYRAAYVARMGIA